MHGVHPVEVEAVYSSLFSRINYSPIPLPIGQRDKIVEVPAKVDLAREHVT